jgi:hypothetical protein
MPLLARIMVRAALIWQALGFSGAALLLAAKAGVAPPIFWNLLEAHLQALFFGWMIQFAGGVAYWIAPRFDAAGSRGRNWPVIGACIGLNLAALLPTLRAVLSIAGLPAPLWLAALGGLCALVGCALLAAHLWPRILPFRTVSRP